MTTPEPATVHVPPGARRQPYIPMDPVKRDTLLAKYGDLSARVAVEEDRQAELMAEPAPLGERARALDCRDAVIDVKHALGVPIEAAPTPDQLWAILNALAPEPRAWMLENLLRAGEDASRCFTEDHDHAVEVRRDVYDARRRMLAHTAGDLDALNQRVDAWLTGILTGIRDRVAATGLPGEAETVAAAFARLADPALMDAWLGGVADENVRLHADLAAAQDGDSIHGALRTLRIVARHCLNRGMPDGGPMTIAEADATMARTAVAWVGLAEVEALAIEFDLMAVEDSERAVVGVPSAPDARAVALVARVLTERAAAARDADGRPVTVPGRSGW